MVNPRISIATQKVAHWTLFLRSCQRRVIEVGRGSSRISFKVNSSLRQYSNFSALRSNALKYVQLSRSESGRTEFLLSDSFNRSHFCELLPFNFEGNRSASVRRVSSAKPFKNIALLPHQPRPYRFVSLSHLPILRLEECGLVEDA
jgi:hypothetical protein